MEDWITIKNLKAKQASISNRQIAKQLGISHNTIKAALERTEAPEYIRLEFINKNFGGR
jgi:predicted ArsR family transcriptional regulator